jgi:hypothetical protein
MEILQRIGGNAPSVYEKLRVVKKIGYSSNHRLFIETLITSAQGLRGAGDGGGGMQYVST